MLKWILYYVAVIAGNIVAANLLHEHLNVTSQSVFPVLYSIIPLILYYAPDRYGVYFDKKRTIAPICDETGTKRWVSYDEEGIFERILKGVSLALFPLCLPFVLFFPNRVKIFSFLLFLAPLAVCVVITMVFLILSIGGIRKDSLERKAKMEKELEEQRRREEQGKWK